jgi:hypothetical protein
MFRTLFSCHHQVYTFFLTVTFFPGLLVLPKLTNVYRMGGVYCKYVVPLLYTLIF